MHHLQKKKMPPLKVPRPQPEAREMPRIEPRTEPIPAIKKIEVTDYNQSPLFETVSLITTHIKQKYPGSTEFCSDKKYEVTLDAKPYDQIIITSYCIRIETYVKWLNVEHAITVGRFALQKDETWKMTQIFRMAENGYPIEYQEWNDEAERYDIFAVASITPRGTILHGGNKFFIHQEAQKLNEYLLKNRYPIRAKYSGKTIDEWQKEKHARRN